MVIGFTSFGYFYGLRTLELAVSENLPFSPPAPGSIVSVSYCGQGAVNLNSHYLGHSPDQEL